MSEDSVMPARSFSHRSDPGIIWSKHYVLLVVLLTMIASSLVFGAAENSEKLDLLPEYRLPDNAEDLLRMDDAMREYFSARINQQAPFLTKLDQISEAILGEENLHFRYEGKGVYDVREAFRRRRGNCMTYSMLTIAVAREFGVKAKFNEVRNDPEWNRSGGIVLVNGHINVRVENWPESYELDLKINEELLASRRSAREVSDARAFAGVYSSAGVHRLAKGEWAEAMLLLERATVIDPKALPAWTNLGSAFVTLDQLDRAQVCYERALDIDRKALAALSGLATIHRAMGRSDEAAKLERRVTRYRERNPYYLLNTAREASSKGDLKAARRHLKRAIRIKKDEPEIYQLMAEVSLGLGLEKEAKRWLKLSEKVES